MNEGTIAALNATNEQLERDLADARRALWLVLRMAPNCTVRIPKTMLEDYDRSTCVITGSLDGASDNVRLSAASLAPPNNQGNRTSPRSGRSSG